MRYLAIVLFALSACQELPGLPEEGDRSVPEEIRPSVDTVLVAGKLGRAWAEVYDQFGEPMVGQPVVARSMIGAGEELALTFPLGNSCLTVGGETPGCAIPIHAPGPTGTFALTLASGPKVSEVQRVEVRADRSSAELEVSLPGRLPLRWRVPWGEGETVQDPLALAETLQLSRGEPVELGLRLIDRFGNSVGEDLVLALTHQGDGVAPATVAIGPCGDGSEFGPGTTNRLEGLGRICLRGDEVGDSVLSLSLGELTAGRVLREGEAVDDLRLRLFTQPAGGLALERSGLPVEDLACDVGGSTSVVVQVVDAEGTPVPERSVSAEVHNLSSVLPSSTLSDAEGRAEFTVYCPAQRRGDGQLRIWLPEVPTAEERIDVRVAAGHIARVEAELENVAPGPGEDLHRAAVGEPSTLIVRAFDEHHNAVAEGVIRLELAQQLAGRLLLRAPACGGNVGDSLNGLACELPESGAITIPFEAGGVLLDRPIVLTISGDREGGEDPDIDLSIRLVGGLARQATISPAGRMAAVVGADGGEILLRSTDAGGNRIAGVRIELAAPAAVRMSPVGSQISDENGLARWRVAELLEPGEHELVFTAHLAGGPEVRRLTLSTTVGRADRLRLRRGDGAAIGRPSGTYAITGRVGEPLPVLILSQHNGAGGLVPGPLGLTLTTEGDAEGCDPMLALAGAQLGESGELRFGGEELPLSFGTRVRRCEFLITADTNSIVLRLEQEVGTPVGGQIELNVGSEAEPAWRALEADARLEPLFGFAEDPEAPTFAQRHDLRVSGVRDAFGNAWPAGQAIQPVAVNAWVGPERPEPVDGVFRFWVAGGAGIGRDAQVALGSSRGWQDAPRARFRVEQGAPTLELLRVRGVDRKAYDRYGNDPDYMGDEDNRPRWTGGAVFSNGGNAVAVDPNAAGDLLLRDSGDGVDPDEAAVEDPQDGRNAYLDPEHHRDAQLVEVSLYGVNGAPFAQLPTGRCDEEQPCSRARLLWLNDGLRALPEPTVLGLYPMWRDTAPYPESNELVVRYRSLIPMRALAAGGVFGVAVEADAVGNGDALRSAPQPLYAPTKAWLRPRGLVVQAPPGDATILRRYRDAGVLPEGWLDGQGNPILGRNFARILDVRLVQADQDEAQEILLCGDDAFGGWVALADPDTERAARGANPFGDAPLVAVRTYRSAGQVGEELEFAWHERALVGAAGGAQLCDFLARGPTGAPLILSPGLPSARAGQASIYLTPVVAGEPVAPQPLVLRGAGAGLDPVAIGFSDQGSVAAELAAWSGDIDVTGTTQHFDLAASGQALTLGRARAGAALARHAYDAPQIDLDGDGRDEACTGHVCTTDGGDGERRDWAGGDLKIHHGLGRIVGAVNWGGQDGLIAFDRHSNRLAWYLPHRRSQACAAQNGALVCPAVCGDGELDFGEACEPGAGCSQACEPAGQVSDASAAALAVPFGPAQWRAAPGPIQITTGLAASPIQTDRSEAGLMNPNARTVRGLTFGDAYDNRRACRALGGDLPSEAQWERVAGGGTSRTYPWGAQEPQTASARLGRGSTRIGEHYLGHSAEGLADLAGAATRYGEDVLDENGALRAGDDPLRLPLVGGSNIRKGGGSDQRSPSVSARYHYARTDDHYGAARCVWSVRSP